MPSNYFSNQLLDMLPDEEIKRISSAIEFIDLKEGDVLFRTDAAISYVYFPVSATLSLLHSAKDSPQGGIALIGNEGMAGVCFNLTQNPALPYTAVVQIAGKCIRIPSEEMLNSFKRSTDVMFIVMRYSQALLSQMAQTALCNWSHPVDQRLARWLLLTNDLAGKNEVFASKQDIAKSLNVPMELIVGSILKLEGQNTIRYSNECLQLLDLKLLKSSACECYSRVNEEYRLLLPRMKSGPNQLV
jgi:CRP-like cAMP-binding protein